MEGVRKVKFEVELLLVFFALTFNEVILRELYVETL